MRNQSWGNTARQQDSLRRVRKSGFLPSFRVVEQRVQYNNAGFWLRLFAWWWDTLLFSVMQIAVILPLCLTLVATATLSLQTIKYTFGTQQGLRSLLNSGNISPVLLGMGVISVGLYCLYHVSFEVLCKGFTPGKWLIGIRVLDGEDAPLTIGQSLARNIYKFTSFGIIMFGLILSSGLIQSRIIVLVPIVLVVSAISAIMVGAGGYLMAGFTVHKQTLHDKWSYSYVVIDPACSNAKRITFSVIAAVAIILTSAHLHYALRSRLEQADPSHSRPYSFIIPGKDI